MARIAGVDLPNKRLVVALTYIYGIGRKTSESILAKAQIDESLRANNLTDAQIKERLKNWKAPEPRYKTGVMAKYAKLVSSASEGAVTGFGL